MNGETFHANGSNGAVPAPAPEQAGEHAPAPSLETTLFKAGLITADQLGEIVLERVQSGRPAGDIVVERGLVSPEALAHMLAAASPAAEPASAPVAEPVPAPVVEPAPAPVAEAAPAPAAPFAAAPAPAPAAAVPQPSFVTEAATPAPAQAALVEPAAPVTTLAPPPEPSAEVQALAAQPTVEVASVAPAIDAATGPQEPSVAEPQQPPEAEPVAGAQPGDRDVSMGEVQYGIRIRLSEGVTLDAGSYPSREHAVEIARGIAGQLATESAEWPLVGETLVRPDAVRAIEIESAVSWVSSRSE